MYKALFGAVAAVCLCGNAAWASCSVTNSLTNGTTADAAKVYGNFTDLAACAAPASGGTLTGSTFNGTTSFPGGVITSSGRIGIGTSSPGAALAVVGTMMLQQPGFFGGGITDDVGRTVFAYAWDSTDGNTTTLRSPEGASVLLATQLNGFKLVVNSGGVQLTSGATSWSAISDERMKDWSIAQSDYRSAIQNLWVGDYLLYSNFAKTGASNERFGLRAQQAYAALPAGLRDMAVHKGDDKSPWTVSAEPLAFLALWGAKDLYQERIADQKRVANLEAEVRSQGDDIAKLGRTNVDLTTELQTLRRHMPAIASNNSQIGIHPADVTQNEQTDSLVRQIQELKAGRASQQRQLSELTEEVAHLKRDLLIQTASRARN